jgi:hypothetical protein
MPCVLLNFTYNLRYIYALCHTKLHLQGEVYLCPVSHQTSPTSWVIFMPCVSPNFTYNLRYIYALCLTKLHLQFEVYLCSVSYRTSPTRWGTFMPCVHTKFTYPARYISALPPYQTPHKLHLPTYRIAFFCAVKQNNTIHALVCLLVVVSHPQRMSLNQFGYFSKICYPCTIWGI